MPNKPLREIVSIKKGKQLNIEHMVHGGTFLVLNGGITPSGYTNDWNTEANTITISEGGNSCGYVSLVKQRFWSGGHNYTLNDCKIDKHYLYQYLKHKERQIMALRVGSGLPNIQMRSLVDFEVPILNEKEQYRIGSFLSAIDRLIEKQKDKVDRIKTLKKGYIQKMFPEEGEEIPKIRFRGFSNKWEIRTLESLFVRGGSGGTPLSTNQKFYQGTIPFLSISDITNSNGNIYNTEKKISKEGLDNSSAWLVPSESISLAMYASVGKVAILKTECATSQAFYNMVFDDMSLRDIIFQILKFMETNKAWNRLTSTGTQPNLNAEKVRNFKLLIPNSVLEREKLSNFFSSIDTLIEKEAAAIERYESLKKGYLQKIFADQEGNS
jgi:type I restriction enzyme S subunit